MRDRLGGCARCDELGLETWLHRHAFNDKRGDALGGKRDLAGAVTEGQFRSLTLVVPPECSRVVARWEGELHGHIA